MKDEAKASAESDRTQKETLQRIFLSEKEEQVYLNQLCKERWRKLQEKQQDEEREAAENVAMQNLGFVVPGTWLERDRDSDS